MRRTLDPRLLQVIQQADTVALCCHVNPDGDAIGSMLATKLALTAIGKQVYAFCDGKVPDNLTFLHGSKEIARPETVGDMRFDLFIALDCADEKRLGTCNVLMALSTATAQIDHHATNTRYCGVNEIDGEAAACALLVQGLISQLDIPLTREMAECLYAGLSTDTGNFSYGSVNSECFENMAALMETGIDLPDINRTLFRLRPKAQIKLLSRALSTLTFLKDDRVTCMTLTANDFIECGALPEHADTIVNFGLDIPGVQAAVLLREAPTGIKVSLRAFPPAKVSDVAQRFGGGGHALAAGCSLNQMTLSEAKDALCAAMVEALPEEQA